MLEKWAWPHHTFVLNSDRSHVLCMPRKTDEIRIVGILSAFDSLDVADEGHKEANQRADDFSTVH